MFKSFIYLFGALSLHFTDLTHSNAFFSLFLPLLDAFFLIFLCWQLLFFMSLNSGFSDGGHYSLSDLLQDIYDLRYDIQEYGLAKALFDLVLNLFDAACFFIAVYYYYDLSIQLVSL